MAKRTAKPPVAPAPARDELLTADDVAALLKISRGTLYNNVSAGLFPPGARMPGVGLRWRRSMVDTWIAKQFSADRTA